MSRAPGESLPPGPSSLRELLSWSDRAVALLSACGKRKNTLSAFVAGGLSFRTHYSGYDNPSTALHFLQRSLKAQGIACGPFSCDHACDIEPSRRDVLLEWDRSTRAAHVFGDMLDRLPGSIMSVIAEMQPDYGMVKRCQDPVAQRAMVADASVRYKKIADLIDDHASRIFAPSASARCYLHGRRCPCCVFEGGVGGWTIVIAGSNCQAWSSKGLQLGCAHPSMLTWLCFAYELKVMLPDIWVHEITPFFPWKLFNYVLGGRYRIQEFHDLCPTLLGHPVRRPRQYLVGFRIGVAHSTANEAEFRAIFACRLMLSGSVYFAAPSQDVHRHMSEMARKRKIAYDDKSADIAYEDLLPPGKRLALDDIRRQTSELENPDLVVDLEASATWRGRPTSTIPCLVSHAELYCLAKKRSAIPREHLLMQGMPAYKMRPGKDGADFGFDCPFRNMLSTMSGTDIVSMAGNGMHLAVIGSLLAYVMSTTTRITGAADDVDGDLGAGDSGGVGHVMTWDEAMATARAKSMRAATAAGAETLFVAGGLGDDDI